MVQDFQVAEVADFQVVAQVGQTVLLCQHQQTLVVAVVLLQL
jgi:hypothetical protein